MTTQAEIEQRILDFIRREILRNQPGLNLDTDLLAAGFDSLSLVSFLLFVEREFGVWIPEREITADILANIRSLAAHVLKRVS
ncbi:MAG: acyl carrier protein [bacterium]